MFKYTPERMRLMASEAGYGFVCPEAELESSRKAGKRVVSVPSGSALIVADEIEGDFIAVIGTNKKMLVFPLEDLPEMVRGKGVKLQKYSGDNHLVDAIVFHEEDGLFAMSNGRMRSFPEWRSWIGRRAQAGKVAPKGFPRSGLFNG